MNRKLVAVVLGALPSPPFECMVECTLLRIPEKEGHITNGNISSDKIIESCLLAHFLQAISESRLFAIRQIEGLLKTPQQLNFKTPNAEGGLSPLQFSINLSLTYIIYYIILSKNGQFSFG